MYSQLCIWLYCYDVLNQRPGFGMTGRPLRLNEAFQTIPEHISRHKANAVGLGIVNLAVIQKLLLGRLEYLAAGFKLASKLQHHYSIELARHLIRSISIGRKDITSLIQMLCDLQFPALLQP